MMVLKNVTKGTILAKDLKEASSLINHLFGLLRPSNSRSLQFRTRFGIHTFGLKKPIDIIALDKALKIVKLKENLKPNRLFFWNPKYNLVIELPAKTLQKTNTSLGCYLELKMV